MDRSLLTCALLAALCAPLPALAGDAPGPDEPPRVALLPLDPIRLPGDALLLLQTDLQASLERRAGARVLPQDEMLLHLQAVRALGLSCDRESIECINRIGALANVGLVVRGVAERRRASSSGYEALLQLWLYDAGDGRVLSFVYAFLPGEDEVRKAAIDDAWSRLFAPADNGGTLDIVSEVDGAEVFVDTIRVGETPLPFALTGVLPGEHVVEVRKDGHEPLRSQPTVGIGEEVELYALLAPEENDPIVPDPAPVPPVRFGVLPGSMMTIGVILMVAGSIAGIYGLSENAYRYDVTRTLRGYDVLYRTGNYDVTGPDASSVVRAQSEVSDNLVPYWAYVGGGAGFVMGVMMVSGGLTLFTLEEG